MTKPKMILFDYGETLVHEMDFKAVEATAAVMKYAVENKNNLDPEDIQRHAMELNINSGRFNLPLEIHNHNFNRFLYEYLGISIGLDPVKAEEVFWETASPGLLTQGITDFLDFLKISDIRKGVISNMGYSGDALKNRINRYLPEHDFEFIIASSDYMFKKPSPYIFKLAMAKAGLDASDIWFCGDNPEADILGSSNAGMFPVWYYTNRPVYYERPENITPACPHLKIDTWKELEKFIISSAAI